MEKNILVVDDNPINLKLLESILEDEYSLRLYTDVKKAIESAIKNIPDLILMDIKMPIMDGYEACKQLKEQEDLKETPIIFLSAGNDKEMKEKAYAVGGADYIEKPFKIDEILTKITQFLS
jgi:CheY-like chemotaxis protein